MRRNFRYFEIVSVSRLFCIQGILNGYLASITLPTRVVVAMEHGKWTTDERSARSTAQKNGRRRPKPKHLPQSWPRSYNSCKA